MAEDGKHPEKKKGEAQKVRKIAMPDVWSAGDDGHYLISIFVGYEDGCPVSLTPVRLLISRPGVKPEIVKDLKTDEHGFTDYMLDFTESECGVTVQAGGRQIQIKNLQGPTGAKCPPAVPEAPTDILKKGLLDTLCWFREKIREHKRHQLLPNKEDQKNSVSRERPKNHVLLISEVYEGGVLWSRREP